MSEDNFQERTEKATSRRRQKAREEGKVARSMELNSAVMLCLGFLALYMVGPYLSGHLQMLMRSTMAGAPSIAVVDPTYISIFSNNMLKFFVMLLPVFAVMIVVALGSNIAQVGMVVSTKSIEPKLEKLDITKGLKRLVSMRTMVQGFRDSLKLLVIAIVSYFAIESEFDQFMFLADQTIVDLAVAMTKTAVVIALKIGGVFLLIAALDFLYQRFEFEKSIRMSKQEIKDEMKDTEGSPQLKSRVRQIQREMARSRMMQAVPTADVVVTNPTQIAVALKYDQGEMTAPQVVAKGERMVAKRIKELALDHDIPVVEDKPLARALFRMCDVGQTVPANLFKAVAELLAYVYRLKGKVIG
ncbi:MAG: flagellar biosynthesis protein FlhB [Candidatus Zixiibacteriota bacterium]